MSEKSKLACLQRYEEISTCKSVKAYCIMRMTTLKIFIDKEESEWLMTQRIINWWEWPVNIPSEKPRNPGQTRWKTWNIKMNDLLKPIEHYQITLMKIKFVTNTHIKPGWIFDNVNKIIKRNKTKRNTPFAPKEIKLRRNAPCTAS